MFKEFIFHHIGIATANIERTAVFYLEAGYTQTPVIYDPIQQVNICFLSRNSAPLIELVSPFTEASPVTEIIRKSGVTPYHICYEVGDIYDSILKLKKKRFLPLFNPIPAAALENRLICFLYNMDFGLIELLQSNKAQ